MTTLPKKDLFRPDEAVALEIPPEAMPISQLFMEYQRWVEEMICHAFGVTKNELGKEGR